MTKNVINGIKYNHEEGTIELTKKAAKAASVYGSEEYDYLMNLRKDFPEYKVVVKNSSRRTKKDCLKGLDYDFMRKYIANHGDESDMAEFTKMTVRNDDTIKPKSYGVVKKWFLEKFNEVA